jgi:hypothetical protein
MEWERDLYDFSDPEVRLKYVPQLGQVDAVDPSRDLLT